MSKITNDGLNRSGTDRMLYSCTHTATVGVKGLTNSYVVSECHTLCLKKGPNFETV